MDGPREASLEGRRVLVVEDEFFLADDLVRALKRHGAEVVGPVPSLDRALAADPEDPEALLERGVLRQRRGDPAGARADWERAVELAPDTPAGELAQQNLALLDAGPERR